MEARTNVKIAVGLFVFVGLLLFGASIFLLGQRGRYFAPQHSLKASFTNVAGLHEGAAVRLAGVAVGRVTRIQVPRPPDQKVLVELNVAGDAIENVRQDSVARLETLGFLGDKFIDIRIGSPQAPRVPEGGTLAVGESAELGALVAQGQRVLGHAERIGASLETMLSALEQAKTVEAVGSAVRTVERLATSLDRGDGALPWLMKDPESKHRVAGTLASAQAVTASLERGQGALPWLIHDPAGRHMMQELGRTAETFAALSDEVKAGRGLAHALIYDPEGGRLVGKASETLRGADALLQAIRTGEGVVPTLLFDRNSKELVNNLIGASKRLEEISGKMARGEGTLGAFLVDPTVYEDLTDLLEGSRRSWLLRWGIRRIMESGREAREAKENEGTSQR